MTVQAMKLMSLILLANVYDSLCRLIAADIVSDNIITVLLLCYSNHVSVRDKKCTAVHCAIWINDECNTRARIDEASGPREALCFWIQCRNLRNIRRSRFKYRIP